MTERRHDANEVAIWRRRIEADMLNATPQHRRENWRNAWNMAAHEDEEARNQEEIQFMKDWAAAKRTGRLHPRQRKPRMARGLVFVLWLLIGAGIYTAAARWL